MTLHYHFEWQAAATTDVLWPLVSDTRRMNKAAGIVGWQFRSLPKADAAPRREGRAIFAWLDVVWDEHPFEWVEGERFSVERRYHGGPYESIVSRVVLTPRAGGTLLTQELEVEPRGLIGRLLAPVHLGVLTQRQLDRAYRGVIAFAQSNAATPFPAPLHRFSADAEARLTRGLDELKRGQPAALVERLGAHLREGTADELSRLRPFALAHRWSVERMLVLKLFLAATRAGLLTMGWRLLCPHCRGARQEQRMREIRRLSFCESCQSDFEADFSRNVELVFAVAAQVRPADAADYCIGGPWATPHVVVQQRVEAGGHATVPLALQPGSYRLRRTHDQSSVGLIVSEDGAAALALNLSEKLPETTVRLRRDVSLELSSGLSFETTVCVERTAWIDDVATADVVTSCQEFRDLFVSEVLESGEELNVTRMTFLFTDLKGSTALYDRVGDASAYALVRRHFTVLEQAVRAHDGAIVKTIGDAVMAVFIAPDKALAAARAMLSGVAALETGSGTPLVLKVGMHAGRSLAVNLNDRLDYFGSTVNLAARMEGESRGNDLVTTQDLASDPGAAAFLSAVPHRAEPFERQVKGFSAPIGLVRIAFDAAD